MDKYPVKYIHGHMRGAPVISDTPGSRIAAFDAFLITGFGMVTAQSVSVTDGVATAQLPAGQTFEPHTIIRVAGALPDELNGEARVLTASADKVTFETDAPNGLASGSITLQVAPVGHWEKVFSGPNVAVYKSAHPHSLGFYWRVDDSAPREVRVRGFESMTDAHTGTGPFPAQAQLAHGGAWQLLTSSLRGTLFWDFVADGRFFLCAFAAGSNGDGNHRAAPPRGFGDLVARSGADRWAAAVAAGGAAGSNFDTGSFVHIGGLSSDQSGIYLPRGHDGQGASARVRAGAYVSNYGSTSGGESVSNGLGPAPNPIDGAIDVASMFLRLDDSDRSAVRADVPGALYCPQSNLFRLLKPRDTLTGAGALAGRRLLALPTETYASTWPARGMYLIDTTGPWREA